MTAAFRSTVSNFLLFDGSYKDLDAVIAKSSALVPKGDIGVEGLYPVSTLQKRMRRVETHCPEVYNVVAAWPVSAPGVPTSQSCSSISAGWKGLIGRRPILSSVIVESGGNYYQTVFKQLESRVRKEIVDAEADVRQLVPCFSTLQG